MFMLSSSSTQISQTTPSLGAWERGYRTPPWIRIFTAYHRLVPVYSYCLLRYILIHAAGRRSCTRARASTRADELIASSCSREGLQVPVSVHAVTGSLRSQPRALIAIQYRADRTTNCIAFALRLRGISMVAGTCDRTNHTTWTLPRPSV